MKVEFVVAFKLSCDFVKEACFGVEARNLELVLKSQQLEIVARDRPSQRVVITR